MVDAVKKSEDGTQLVVRLHDFSGGWQRADSDSAATSHRGSAAT